VKKTLKHTPDVDSFFKFSQEFEKESDRAAVILGAAKIDLTIYEILRRFLVASPSANDELLDGDTPLATFSAKINILYRLGLVDADFARALHLIRRIRNAFAHELSGCQLESGAHRDRVRELYAPFSKFENTKRFHELLFKNHKGPSAEFRTVLAVLVARLEALRDRIEPLNSKKAKQLIPEAWMKDAVTNKVNRRKKQKNSEHTAQKQS